MLNLVYLAVLLINRYNMTKSLVDQAKKNSKNYTEKQTILLNEFSTNGFDGKAAALEAGYSATGIYSALKALKTELLEIAEMQLVTAAPTAAKTVVDLMTSTTPIPQAAVKLNASQTVLDRVGLGKKELVQHEHSVSGGIFLIPSKDPIPEKIIKESASHYLGIVLQVNQLE